ncbi:NTP pyrophosphohydrolase [Flavimobilis marinus]|uniref:NAD(+) diphosphatase n=1 Tax=Flavimobilis marinus TaxID=285351 RepID=A0A1I2DFY4_9MICO|nr:NAD(+) diphosphatase [Flavimobilis marinus]GHG45258.1 NTP pyrophosphohydrolase [Flavimobilis marinus]SFE79446.1 NAD+ diphosphatase [Flavimobilis marinus]
MDPQPPTAPSPRAWRAAPVSALSRAGADRAALRREETDLVPRLLADAERTRVVLVRGGEVAVDADGRLDLVAPEPDAAAGRLAAFLGEDAQHAYVALLLDQPSALDPVLGADGLPAAERWPEAGRAWASLRDQGETLDDRDAGLATAAVALAAWHARHPRCPRCGEPTTPTRAGWARRCSADGSEHFPRTDPAVIMAVVDDTDRLLLGHAAHWPDRRFSTLAGFVEAGESAEGAVRREVAEETAIVVSDVEYVTSQPWPFPASLMLAYRARATTTTIEVDGTEVTDARWFTRDGLARDVASGDVLLPPPSSVARLLIEDWFGGPVG